MKQANPVHTSNRLRKKKNSRRIFLLVVLLILISAVALVYFKLDQSIRFLLNQQLENAGLKIEEISSPRLTISSLSAQKIRATANIKAQKIEVNLANVRLYDYWKLLLGDQSTKLKADSLKLVLPQLSNNLHIHFNTHEALGFHHWPSDWQTSFKNSWQQGEFAAMLFNQLSQLDHFSSIQVKKITATQTKKNGSYTLFSGQFSQTKIRQSVQGEWNFSGDQKHEFDFTQTYHRETQIAALALSLPNQEPWLTTEIDFLNNSHQSSGTDAIDSKRWNINTQLVSRQPNTSVNGKLIISGDLEFNKVAKAYLPTYRLNTSNLTLEHRWNISHPRFKEKTSYGVLLANYDRKSWLIESREQSKFYLPINWIESVINFGSLDNLNKNNTTPNKDYLYNDYLEIFTKKFSINLDLNSSFQLISKDPILWTWHPSGSKVPAAIFTTQSFQLANRPELHLNAKGDVRSLFDNPKWTDAAFDSSWETNQFGQEFRNQLKLSTAKDQNIFHLDFIQLNTFKQEPVKQDFIEVQLSKTNQEFAAYHWKNFSTPDKFDTIHTQYYNQWAEVQTAIESADILNDKNPAEQQFKLYWDKLSLTSSPLKFEQTYLNIDEKHSLRKFQLNSGPNSNIELSITGEQSLTPSQLPTSADKTAPWIITALDIKHPMSDLSIGMHSSNNTKNESTKLILDELDLELFLNQLGIEEISTQGKIFGVISLKQDNHQIKLTESRLTSANVKGTLTFHNKNTKNEDNIQIFPYERISAHITDNTENELELEMKIQGQKNEINVSKSGLKNPFNEYFQHLIQILAEINAFTGAISRQTPCILKDQSKKEPNNDTLVCP